MMATFLRNILARRIIRRRIAARIRACFDGLDLTRHSFVAGGFPMRTATGCDQFYRADEIDKAIANINALMRDLRGLPQPSPASPPTLEPSNE